MRDLLAAPMFGSSKAVLEAHGDAIKSADMVHLTAPATVDGVLAIGQLEAAFLDLGSGTAVVCSRHATTFHGMLLQRGRWSPTA